MASMSIYKDANDVEWMRGGEYMCRVMHREGRFAVVKIPGHTVWAGVNLGRDYIKAEFVVYEDVRTTGESLWMQRFSFPVKS